MATELHGNPRTHNKKSGSANHLLSFPVKKGKGPPLFLPAPLSHVSALVKQITQKNRICRIRLACFQNTYSVQKAARKRIGTERNVIDCHPEKSTTALFNREKPLLSYFG